MESRDLKNLKKRYLIWLYKTTKEAVDKIERKFTQLDIDKLILKEIKSDDKKKALKKFILEFEKYIEDKEKNGLSLKYEGSQLKPEYHFLILKLKAIEKAILKELGKPALKEIKDLYEKQMCKRILEERQEKV
jgi:hypothetical protein